VKKLAGEFTLVTITAYLGFILIGLGGGLLGVAWPAMQIYFEQPIDAMAVILTVSTTGYLIASFGSGIVVSRLGYGRMFILALILIGCGWLGVALSHSWGMLIVITFIGSLGTALLDAGLNAYMAAHHSAREMNWLHACYGIGITISPLVMTAAVANAGWQYGYLVAAIAALLLLSLFVLSRKEWMPPVTASSTTGIAFSKRQVLIDTLRSPLIWLSVVLFLIYAGVESLPGQWGYSLFTEVRGMNVETAGFWVSFYWGSFTIGRLFFGAIMPKLSPIGMQRGCIAGTLLGGLLFWWNPSNTVGVIGLVILGFAQAPLFPLFVLNTPRMFGEARASYAIGFQLAGAGVGIALLPGIVGSLAATRTLVIMPPFLVVMVVVLIIISELLLYFTSGRMRQVAVQGAGD